MIPTLVRVLGILLLVVSCAPPETGEKTETPSKAATGPSGAADSARQALDIFIQGQQEGNLAKVQSVLPPGTPFKLSGEVHIENYTVRSTRLLDADQAVLESVNGPKREAGDVVLDVQENYAGGRSRHLTYYVRDFGGGWRIYGWSFQLDQ